MNCQHFEAIINDLARDQMIEVATREAALAHTKSCPRCATRLADERALTAGLRRLAESAASESAPARVEAALLVALAEFHSAPAASPAASQAAEPHGRSRWAVGVAAAALVLLALIGLRLAGAMSNAPAENVENVGQPEPTPTEPARVDGPRQPPPSVVTSRGGERPKLARQKIARVSSPRRQGSRQTVAAADRAARKDETAKSALAQSAPEEITTGFIPLTYGNNFSPLDSGQVVRVELPRSALVSFGLPMNMERARERIKADILLGNDGVARAIRFVR